MFWFSKKTKEVHLGKCWADDEDQSVVFWAPTAEMSKLSKCVAWTPCVWWWWSTVNRTTRKLSVPIFKITANNTVCLHFYFVNHINVNQFKALIFRVWSCSWMLEMSFSPSVQAETGSATFNIRWAKTDSCLSITQCTSSGRPETLFFPFNTTIH